MNEEKSGVRYDMVIDYISELEEIAAQRARASNILEHMDGIRTKLVYTNEFTQPEIDVIISALRTERSNAENLISRLWTEERGLARAIAGVIRDETPNTDDAEEIMRLYAEHYHRQKSLEEERSLALLKERESASRVTMRAALRDQDADESEGDCIPF